MARLQCWCAIALQASIFGAPASAAESPLRAGMFVQVGLRTGLDEYLGSREGPAEPVSPVGVHHAQVLLEGEPFPYSAFSLRVEGVGTRGPHLAESQVSFGPEWLRLAVGKIRAPLGAEFLTEVWDLPASSRAPLLFEASGFYSAPVGFENFVSNAAQTTLALGGGSVVAWAGDSDVAARVAFPASPSLTGGAYYLASNPLLPERRLPLAENGSRPAFRDRWGADARWQEGPSALAAEIHRGFETTRFGGQSGVGFLVYTTLEVSGGQTLLMRYEHDDPDMSGVLGEFPRQGEGAALDPYGLLPVEKQRTAPTGDPGARARNGEGRLRRFQAWADRLDTAEGGRNHTLYSLMAEGLGRGLDPADVEAVARDYCRRSGLLDGGDEERAAERTGQARVEVTWRELAADPLGTLAGVRTVLGAVRELQGRIASDLSPMGTNPTSERVLRQSPD